MLITCVINVFYKLIAPLMVTLYTDQTSHAIRTRPETAARIECKCLHHFSWPCQGCVFISSAFENEHGYSIEMCYV